MEESELLELREKLEDKKKGIGLVGTRLNVRRVNGSGLSASITTDWKEIEINYGGDLNLVPDEKTKRFIERKGIRDVNAKTGEDLLDHEAGHRENRVYDGYGCPFDCATHDEIKDSVARGLKKIGKEGLESYVTNAFEDIIDNVNCRRFGDFSGQTLFWNNQGFVNSENGKFGNFYEAFVRINLFLGGNVMDYSLLRRYFGRGEETDNTFREYLEVMRRELELDNRKSLLRLHKGEGFEKLFEQDKDKRLELWKKLGYEFAVRVGRLLDEVPKQRMFGSCDGDENSEEQNPFDREMKIPGNRQEVAFRRYKSGKGPVVHRDLESQLYDFYKKASREIRVETSDYLDSEQMPLVRFGRKFVGDEGRAFRFKGVGINSEGEIGLKTTKHSIDFPVSYKRKPRKFKKFKIAMVDRSGSMALSPDNDRNVGDKSFVPWGDGSKYHFALKGYFGIDNFFERQGILRYIESCALGFSGENAVRGSSESVAKSLLSKPSGGTYLDVDSLENELEREALMISISDGEFDCEGGTYEAHLEEYVRAKEAHDEGNMSWGDFRRVEERFEDNKWKERFEKKIESCDYAHIQIGEETDYCYYLAELGRPVIRVKGDNDLSRAMVSFVSGYYKSLNVGRSKKR